MATTTNYNWSTPDNTALVKDGASAIRTLGSSIDTTTKALNPSTTLGDVEYRSATANTNTRLPIGTTGQVLTVAGGVPTWATPAAGGGGKVLQVVTSVSTTEVTNTTTTYTDTNLSASITPSSSSSRILVLISQQVNAFRSGYDTGLLIRIVRGSTTIWNPGRPTLYGGFGVTPDGELDAIASYSYIDSPATTSSTTYKTQFIAASGATARCQRNSSPSSIILMEIGA